MTFFCYYSITYSTNVLHREIAKLLVKVGQKATGLPLKIAELHKNAVDGYLYITYLS